MNRLCLVALFCIMGTFASAQNDCSTQDSLALVTLKNRLEFKPGFEWNLALPMENWYGVILSPEGCIEQLNLSGVLNAFRSYTFNTYTLPQLTHINLSNNNLTQLPHMTAATQLLYVNVAHNQLDFKDLQRLPNDAEIIYVPQAMLNCPMDIQVFVGTDYTIQLDYYGTQNDVFVWYKDGIVIDTTTTYNLELTDIQFSDAGNYMAIITDPDFPDLILETAPIVLNVGDCSQRDSLVLVDFYHRNEFKAEFDWDIESPMESWYGVTLSPEGCLEQLDLSGAIYGQNYYYYGNFGDLSQLSYLDLSDNKLNALPDLREAHQLTYLNIADNNLDFSDLSARLPDSIAGEIIYAPQGILNCPMNITAYINTDYTITLDYYGTDNDIFVWYKDGTTIVDTTTTYKLELTDIQLSDAGLYSAIITDTNFPDLTLETAPIVLSVEGCRARDSLALVHLYHNITFKQEASQWDFSQPIDTWYGVTLSAEGCLERLEIPNTLEGGYIISTNSHSIRYSTNLTHLDLSNNGLQTITGVLQIPNLTYLNLQNNQLGLRDLLPFAYTTIDSFIYAPQLSVPVYPDAVVDVAGSSRVLGVDMYVYQNPGHVFKWYRDGIEVATITDDGELSLTNLQVEDSGMYICEITNPALPDLVLYSDSISVLIAPNTQHLDSLILVNFYESTTFKAGHDWDLSQKMNTWEGVTLNDENRVKELILPNTLTAGELHSTLQQLADLETIDLSNNNLTGGFLTYDSYNPEILPQLSYVDLSDNQLSEHINLPQGMSKNLKHLDISNNQIGGIYNILPMTSLEYLDLSNNPTNYNDVLSLTPASADLEVLKLANTRLQGTSTNYYYYYNNYADLAGLRTIELQDNNITGLLPNFFTPSVETLNVSGNRLTFNDLLQANVPPTYIYAPQDTAGISHTIYQTPGSDYTIYIDFDADVENSSYAWYKDGNYIITTTDGSLSLTNLQNADAGDYTCQVTNSTLPDLTLHTKSITLVIDEIYASNCRLRDSLALVQIGSAENNGGHPQWDFSQPLGSWGGVELSEEGCVTRISISDDCLTRISPAIGQLLDIEEIYFDENSISGTIPRSIGNLTNLRYFNISDDAIEGPIPVELTTLPNLETLVIESYIKEIPSEIGNLTTLKTLRIGGNFTELPPEIGNLTNLEELTFWADLTTLPAEMSNMTSLKNVSLQHNELSSLPPNLAENWTNLEVINLEYNYLTFDDLIQFQDFNFGYQSTIGTADTIELSVGDDFAIDLGFDESVTDNTYHWFRNSIPVDTTTQNTLLVQNVQLDDAGIYTCQVYNATLSNYVLNTAPITLLMEGNALESPIYPGDTNADGIVNGKDILFWGLAEGTSGEIRPDASAVWTPQPTPDWNYTVAGIDAKHQDADGSGLVDEADLDIVEVNYRKTNADYQYEFYQNDVLQLLPQITQAQNFGASSQYDIDVNLGNNFHGAVTIHGLSFSVDFSPLVSADEYTVQINNTDSWLEPSNVVAVNDEFLRRTDFTLTRNNRQNKTGFGSLGTLSVITNDLPTSDTPQFCAIIQDITAIQSDGTFLHGEDVFIGSFGNGSAEGIIPGLQFEAIAYAATCETPSSATVTVMSGTPPYQYQWSNGDTTAVAENLIPGEYEVIVTDDFGQTLTGMVIVPDGMSLPDIELQTIANGQVEVISDMPDIEYEWIRDGENYTGSLVNLTPGEYTLTVSNSADCSKTVSVWVADIYSNVILEGAYDATSGLMNDQLRELNLIPLTDPYTGRMTTTDAVLQVTGNDAIVDWVLLELHDKDIPGKVMASYPALLRRDGFIISNDGINPPRIAVQEETDYYLVVKHRNHLPVKSGTVVSLANEVTGQAFEQGNASLQKEMNDGTHAAFAGDITTDNTIDGLDKVIWEPLNGTFNQYHAGDTNLDGDINGADKGVWFSNNGTFTDIE